MSKRKVLELYLERLELENSGPKRRSASGHVLAVNLVWPRPAIAERSALKTVELEDGTAELARAGWTEKILFKEQVEGPFGIEVLVTERMSESQLGEFFSFAGSSLLKSAGNEAGDIVSDGIISGMAGIPFKFLSKLAADAGKMPARVLGTGAVDMKDSSLPAGGRRKKIKVSLTVPETVYAVSRRASHGGIRSRGRVLLREGEENGHVVLSCRVS